MLALITSFMFGEGNVETIGIIPNSDSGIPATPRFQVPALFAPTSKAEERFWEFFAANISNANTRRTYLNAVQQFARWCDAWTIAELAAVKPVMIATYREDMLRKFTPATVKVHLAAIRMLLDWMVVGQIIEMNPAHSVRGPEIFASQRQDAASPSGRRTDAARQHRTPHHHRPAGPRAHCADAVQLRPHWRGSSMRVQDYYANGRDYWIRPKREKGGKELLVLSTYQLDDYMKAYIEASGIAGDLTGYLFRSAPGPHRTLTDKPLLQSDAWQMIRRRAQKAGIDTKLCNHSCRAGGITIYMQKGGKLERAQERAGHSDIRTTMTYDHSDRAESRSDVERMAI